MPRQLLLLPAMLLALVATSATAQDYPPPIQALQDRGVRIVGTFDAPGGLTGYAGISRHQPIALYVTANGQYVIVGSMLNRNGQFVHAKKLQQMTAGPMSKRLWTQLQNSNWVAEGDPDAPRTVYVFSDPNCPYCYAFWKQARPWLTSGKVELRHVVVGVISKTSDNKAATIFTADDPGHMLVKNKKLFPKGGITPMQNVPADVQRKLIANMQLMRSLGIAGTPSIIYRDDQGVVQIRRGLPPASMMETILGPK